MPTSNTPLHLDLKGSATGEFVLIALPLFLPALLFFLAMSQVAKSEMETSFIAREAIRAFTTGNDDEEAHLRVQSLLAAYDRPDLAYSVVCSSQPCISPGAGVQITIFQEIKMPDSSQSLNASRGDFWGEGLNTSARNRYSLATASGYVDKWQ